MLSGKESKTQDYRCVIRNNLIGEDGIELTFENFVDDKDLAFDCPADRDTIMDIIEDLRTEISSEVFNPWEFDDLDADEKWLLTKKVANHGHALFNALFCDGARELFLEFAASGTTTVVVKDEIAAVPWEYLCPVAPDGDVSPELDVFLGSLFLFVRRATTKKKGSARADGEDDPFLKPRGKPGFGHLFDDQLGSSKAPDSRSWHFPIRSEIELTALAPLSAAKDKKAEMQAEIVRFVSGTHDVIHFDCDAAYGVTRGRPDVKVRIREGFHAELRDIREWRLRHNVDVLVVLNFCSSEVTALWERCSVARTVHLNGAATVIGVSARVNDAFALLFARELYRQLLIPHPVGTALFNTRRLWAATAIQRL